VAGTAEVLSEVRAAVLAVSLTFVAVLAVLTLYVLVSRGPDPLVLVSVVVVGILGYGLLGAMGAPRR
jgi:hypothetical protein